MRNYDGVPLSASEMWEQTVSTLERDVMERDEIIRAQEIVIAKQRFDICGNRDVINRLCEQVKFQYKRIDQLLAENKELRAEIECLNAQLDSDRAYFGRTKF